MADVVEQIPENKLGLLVKDSAAEGYAFPGPEDFIQELNTTNPTTVRTDQKEQGLRYFTEHHQLMPWTIAEDMNFLSMVDAFPYQHGRPSQFSSSKCPISVLISNIDDVKLENATGKKARIVRATLAGDLRHAIVSAPNLMHELTPYSPFNVPRSEYSEKRSIYHFSVSGLEEELDKLSEYMAGGSLQGLDLWDMTNFEWERKQYKDLFNAMQLDWRDSGLTTYTIKGTADELLTFEDSEWVAILDWKRSRYFKNAFAMQTCAYALGVDQMSGSKADAYFLICAINHYNNRQKDYRMSGRHILQVLRDDILIKTMQLKTVFLHTVIRVFVERPDFLIELRNAQRRETMTKYSKQPLSLCEVIFTGSPCVNLQNQECDILYDYILEGGDLGKLLIDGFQLKK